MDREVEVIDKIVKALDDPSLSKEQVERVLNYVRQRYSNVKSGDYRSPFTAISGQRLGDNQFGSGRQASNYPRANS